MADSYHRKLKETDRFNIIDTDLESDNPSEVLNRGKAFESRCGAESDLKTGRRRH